MMDRIYPTELQLFVFSVLLALRLPRLGKRELILVITKTCLYNFDPLNPTFI